MEQNITGVTPEPELEPEVDELDVEAFAGLEGCKPKAKRYIIKIDKKPFVVEKSILTGRELLTLAGKTPPEKFRIWQMIHGQSHEMTLDEKVDVRAHGVEKFRTLSRTQTDG
jgi:uncharacterized protein (DUF1015 family)